MNKVFLLNQSMGKNMTISKKGRPDVDSERKLARGKERKRTNDSPI